MPPKFVILDDKATWDVLQGTIAKTNILKWWSHDFAGSGTIRDKRVHRGRPAIFDPSATGDARYQYGLQGQKKHEYYFKGARDYTPVVYKALQPAPSTPQKRKDPSPASEASVPKKPRGHNQHTPKDKLVKNGAPSSAINPRKPKPRVNPFLRQDPHRQVYNGAEDEVGSSTTFKAHQGTASAMTSVPELGTPSDEEEDDFWVSMPDKHSGSGSVAEHGGPGDDDGDDVFDDPLRHERDRRSLRPCIILRTPSEKLKHGSLNIWPASHSFPQLLRARHH